MAISNYDDLKSAIATWTVRSDLTASMDDFIDLTEAMFRFEPRPPDDPDLGGLRVEITEATGTLTVSQSYISKPDDWITPYRFDLTGDDGGNLVYLSPGSLPIRTGTGKPKFWTASNVIEFDIPPDSAYPYSVKYYSNPDPLSDSNTSNVVLASYPNVYLSGCLYYAYDFIGDDSNANKWLSRYKAYAWAASQAFKAQNLTQGSISAVVG